MSIGQKDTAKEFIIIAADGRSAISQGLTYYEMAELYRSYGAKLAYNLDGGGSATMVFKGTVINKPSDAQGPRKVADSLFIRNIK